MGKDKTIKRIANLLAQETAHKILLKYLKDPDTTNHLSGEINNYRGNQIPKLVAEYNWNSEDKEEIKKESKRMLINELKRDHFTGISFPESEKDKVLQETIREFFDK